MPEIMIIAGPNGAGKTSFAREYFIDQPTLIFVNADEISRGLDIENENHRNFQASKLMLNHIKKLVNKRQSFVIETTLASLSYAQKIKHWQRLGYHIVLLYLKLPSVQHALERVKHRVSQGGHPIAEEDIRRRFPRSLDYLETIYKPIVNEWYLFNSLEGSFEPAASWKEQ